MPPSVASGLLHEFAQGLVVGRAGDAAFGDDGGDVGGGRDVKGRVFNADAFGGDGNSEDLGDLGGGALFDGDEIAGGEGQVEGGDGAAT